MSAQKRPRLESSDRLMRLLPAKLPKLQSFQACLLPAPLPSSLRWNDSFSEATQRYYAVDLAQMTKTALAYYTARQVGGEVLSDQQAGKASGKCHVTKCACCGKAVDESGVTCGGKCRRLCHPSCGVLLESRGLMWICRKCAGLPRP